MCTHNVLSYYSTIEVDFQHLEQFCSFCMCASSDLVCSDTRVSILVPECPTSPSVAHSPLSVILLHYHRFLYSETESVL